MEARHMGILRIAKPGSRATQEAIRKFKLIVDRPYADTLVEAVRTVVFVDGRIRKQAAHAIHWKARIPEEKAIGRTRLHVRHDGQGAPERCYNLLNLALDGWWQHRGRAGDGRTDW